MKRLVLLACLMFLGGCAVGLRTNELGQTEPVIGFAAGGRSITQAASGILGALGVPGGAAVGLASIATAAAAYFRGSHKGSERGWNEAAATYQPAPPVHVAVVPAVPAADPAGVPAPANDLRGVPA